MAVWKARSTTDRTAGARSNPPFVIWIGSAGDGAEHGVSIDQAEATAQAGTGVYRSLCGIRFHPAAMITMPGPRCRECEQERQCSLSAWQSRTGRFWRLARAARTVGGVTDA